MRILKDSFFLSLPKKNLDPDQLEKWDPDPDPEPHQNVLDPPHCFKGRVSRDFLAALSLLKCNEVPSKAAP